MNTIRFLVGITFAAAMSFSGAANATFIGASNGDLFNLNVATNSSTLIGNTGQLFDIASNGSTLYGVANGGTILVSIDTNNASTTSIGSVGGNFRINGLAFDSNGVLWGSGGEGIYTINLATGAASLVGTTGGFVSGGDIAFDTNDNLFMASSGATSGLISINTANGSGSLIGDTLFSGVYGLDFEGSTLFGFTTTGDTITLDTLTGSGTFVARNSIIAYGADGVATVSSPATLALIGLGLFGIAVRRRLTK